MTAPSSPLIRIVLMTFRHDALPAFHRLFQTVAPRIRAFEGCLHLELWEDDSRPDRMTTFSLWETPEALERYRRSTLFRATWADTKPLFAAPASAQSYHRVPVAGLDP